MTDDHLYDLVIEWDRRRKLGQEVPPEELCHNEPELLEALTIRIESVRRTDGLFESIDTAEDSDFLTKPDIKKIRETDETRAQTKLTTEEFIQAITLSGLMTPEAMQSVQHNTSAESARDLAVALVAQGKLTHYQAAALLERRKDPLVLDRYVVLERLGAGGMGEVFKALHRPMERIVALKMPPPTWVDSPEKVKRFQREVRAAAKLTHPNIVTAYDACESGGVHFLVMELVDGKDLHNLVKSDGPLPVSKAVNYVVQAATGLEHAHACDIVHRDIKPSNLLLDKKGTVKVLDLGLARFESHAITEMASQELTEAGMPMGTVAFMSPEQALDAKHADHRSDIYSLGCTLYFLLTGRPPYRQDTPVKTLVAHREQAIPTLRARRKEVPATLDAIYHKMVAKRPEDRYQSIAEVIEALKDCVIPNADLESAAAVVADKLTVEQKSLPKTQTCQSAARTDEKSPPQPWRRRVGVGVAVGLLLVGLVFSGIVFKIKTAAGTIILECNQPEIDGAVVTVDGEEQITIKIDDKAEPITIKVDKGRRKLEVVKGGFKTFTDEFEIGGGERKPIKVSLERLPEFGLAAGKDVTGAGSRTETTPAVTEGSDRNREAAEWVLSKGGKVTIRVGDSEPQVIDPFGSLPPSEFRLEGIDLSYLAVTDNDLQHLDALKDLQYLYLDGTGVSDAGMKSLSHLDNLTRLYLGATGITDDGLQHLLPLQRLSELNVGATKITDAGMRHLQDFARLTDIWLHKTRITEKGLQEVAKLRQLTFLAIDHNPQINMESLKSLGRLDNLSGLQIGPVTDQGLACIAGLEKLKWLRLIACTVSDKEVTQLEKVKGLIWLGLEEGSMITPTAMETLKKALPNCKIDLLSGSKVITDSD